MIRTEVSENALEVSMPREEAVVWVFILLFVVILTVVGGWQVALVALALSVLGAGMADLVQQWEPRIGGR